MDFSEWIGLPENEQREKCQFLDPWDNRDLFESIEHAFREAYGEKDLSSVRCGLGPFIGPYNCIVAVVARRQSGISFPDAFLGFPVIVEWHEMDL
jgi:hypothetical protein